MEVACKPSFPEEVKGFSLLQLCLGRFCLSRRVGHQMPSSEIERLHHGILLAKKAFFKAVKDGSDVGPFLVAEDISVPSFQLWVTTLETCWKVALIYKGQNTGSVFLFGDPTKLHESVSEWVHDEFVLQAGRLWKSRIQCLGSATEDLRSGLKEPDKSYTSSSTINRFPTVTLEVAYRNEDLPKLIKEVSHWHEAGVNLSMGVKVKAGELKRKTERSFDINMYYVKQTAMQKKPEIVEFSPLVCTAENRDAFLQTFPFSYFSSDVGAGEDFLLKLDLYELQQHILRQLHFEACENQQMLFIAEDGGFKCAEIAACAICKVFLRDVKVRCGHPQCLKWFHPSCAGLIETDRTPDFWFCHSCLKKSEKASKWHKF